MAAETIPKVKTTAIRKLKDERPVAAVTAYDAVTAALADRAGVDLILVGDSVGQALLGFESTLPVTVEMMLHHTAAVARARPKALIVADLPFPEAHRDRYQLLETCRRFLQEAGADAVKLEGGANVAEKVAFLIEAGIPVMGHVGLLPQRYKVYGGYPKVGRNPERKETLTQDALALEKAGAFAVIGENIQPDTAEAIRQALAVPFIGIGCGPGCDGQIAVVNDLLGYNLGNWPVFAKSYADLAESARQAISEYTADVRASRYPPA